MVMFEFVVVLLQFPVAASVELSHVTTSSAPVICPLIVTFPLTKTRPVVRLLRVIGLVQLFVLVEALSTLAPDPLHATRVVEPETVMVIVTLTGVSELGEVPPVMKHP